MKILTVRELLTIVGGNLITGNLDLEINNATPYVESMKKPNTLLFLLRKRKIKWDILYKYKPCVVITDKIFIELLKFEDCTLIKVDNDEEAYQKFINFYRNQFDIPIIAVTGTSGKSTTVGMIEHVLSKHLDVVATKNSANGRTSHFMYLMSIDNSTEAAVFEAAVGKPGDITNACKYYKPQIGVITNIGTHHIDECITQEGYINAKGELLSSLPNDGVLIINSDDEFTSKLPINQFKGRVVTVSTEHESTFTATNIQYTENGMSFDLTYNGECENFCVPGFGRHQVYNALQAIAAANELGINFKQIKEALKTFEKLPLRFQVKKGLNSCILLNDSWNVTTTSLKAALITQKELSKGRKQVVLLGEIHRTGQYTNEIAAQYVELFMKYGSDVDTLVTISNTGELIVNALKAHGFKGKLYNFQNEQGIIELLSEELDNDTIFLLKVTVEDNPDFINRLIIN
jgi:UDP-N-acetylmuramoyl-tripeptide--D-alanyl-D-alanine ligase